MLTVETVGAAGSLARGAALITVATALSRVTGFIRVVVVAAAMGTTFLANTYQTANTAPNLVFELVAAGVLTSVFVPTFVEYLVKGEREEGWRAADALTSIALVGLVVLALLLALGAPLVMRALTIGVEDAGLRTRQVELGSTFLRLFAPQIVFYGAGMIMTAALHAHRRFAVAAVAPIFNNVVVIGVYLTYAAMRGGSAPSVQRISAAETLVLGAGTTLGVVAMTLCLIPQLRTLGWRYRFRLDLSHPAVRRGARLGAWALGYAGGYQAALIVVLMLANRVEGGVAAYQWAYTFFYLPHALFAVPIFSVLFTAMSEHVALGDRKALIERLRDGLAMLAFILLPIAATLVATARPLARLTLGFGAMTAEGTDLVGRILLAFAIGLPTYSAFLVFTRGYYAVGDTKTPALVNAATTALSSAVGALLFFELPREWAVAGLAFGHSVGFAFGAAVLARLFLRRAGARGSTRAAAAIRRSLAATVPMLVVMVAVVGVLPEGGKTASLIAASTTAVVGGSLYFGTMAFLRAPELQRLRGLLPGGRR